MQKIKTYIKKIDLFGVSITVLNNEKEQKYQSWIGGLTSFVIASISLSYFIYILTQWINNDMTPNLSTRQKTNSYEEFTWQTPIITFNLQDFVSNINPFTANNNIITPLLFIIEDKEIIQKPILLFSQDDNDTSISISNGTLVLNNLNIGNGEQKRMQQYLLVFATCKTEYMIETSFCADNQTIDNYMSQYHGLLFLKVNLNQLNYSTKNLDVFQKLYYTAFLPDQFTYSQVMLKQQKTIIDDGILFNNYNDYQFLNNYELINQQVDKNFISNILYQMSNGTYSINGFYSYLFRIDNISIVEEVVMPKLGQILAQIGSIVQVIFLLKYLALFYNETSLERELFHDIITMYYPEFKGIQNFKQFQLQKSQIQDQSKYFKDKYKQILKIAKSKCRFNNILYEISRIQFILENQFGKQTLLSSHELGGKFCNELEENQEKDSANLLEKSNKVSVVNSQLETTANTIQLLLKKN